MSLIFSYFTLFSWDYKNINSSYFEVQDSSMDWKDGLNNETALMISVIDIFASFVDMLSSSDNSYTLPSELAVTLWKISLSLNSLDISTSSQTCAYWSNVISHICFWYCSHIISHKLRCYKIDFFDILKVDVDWESIHPVL